MKKRLFISLSLLLLIGFSIKGILRMTDDFRLSGITHEMSIKEEWKIDPLSENEKTRLKHIFAQKFIYLGKGAQSYAFVSHDNQYVLKFFKFKHLRPNFLLNIVPSVGFLSDWKEGEVKRKEEKLNGVFNAYRLAWEVHRDRSGLIFIHLNKTDDLNQSVHLQDKIGLNWNVDLDTVNFVLQKRADTSRKVIYDLLSQGKVEEAKHCIRKIFELYKEEYNKGIFDHDHGVMHNTGFVGLEPIHLDVGKLYNDPSIKEPKNAYLDIVKIGWKIDQAILANFPKYSLEIRQDIENTIANTYDSSFTFESFNLESIWQPKRRD